MFASIALIEIDNGKELTVKESQLDHVVNCLHSAINNLKEAYNNNNEDNAFKDFKNNIKIIFNAAKERHKLAEFTKKLYVAIQSDFKNCKYRLDEQDEKDFAVVINKFITVFEDLGSFFHLFENDLFALSRNTSKKQKELREMHFKTFRRKATSIVNSCAFYTREIPKREGDLEAIRYDLKDADFNSWLQEKRLNSDEKNYLYWCKRLSIVDKDEDNDEDEGESDDE
ncbi:hypothetical protein C2G38_2191396 [Gigaspora rosea]|uniref:Uncharacterized protein n=1 Tax=Gigaspora rosea TaxID=44941 RepID=A0A397V1K8_9GLOM|nr:hypothetical protein C2G38_2191396 [Gigaspora rosea]